MQARRNGFGTTLLMLVPMLAVPVMAIFGIPQFAPVSASPTEPVDHLEHPLRAENRIGFSAAAPGRTIEVSKRQPLDLFQPYASANNAAQDDGDNTASSAQWSDPLKSLNAKPSVKSLPAPTPRATANAREASVRSARQLPQQVYDVFADDFGGQRATTTELAGGLPPAPTPSRVQPAAEQKRLQPEFPQLTWRQAVDRLNTLGASTYRLTPGMHPQEFRFVCFVTSVDDMRITRRFEAESADPLVAVEKVLAQVEQCRR